MKYAPSLRGALRVALLCFATGSTGCIHNHYYTGMPGCPPGSMPIATQAGTSVCDIPSGNVVVSSNVTTGGTISSNVVVPAPPSTVGGSAVPQPQPRVVISQPTYRTPNGPGLSRLKWRRPDPENVANQCGPRAPSTTSRRPYKPTRLPRPGTSNLQSSGYPKSGD